MAKAILVMDMPERCIGCPCEDEGYCQAVNDRKNVVESTKEPPAWCPLKPVPKKKEGEFISEHGQGWNDCIDAICS